MIDQRHEEKGKPERGLERTLIMTVGGSRHSTCTQSRQELELQRQALALDSQREMSKDLVDLT